MRKKIAERTLSGREREKDENSKRANREREYEEKETEKGEPVCLIKGEECTPKG